MIELPPVLKQLYVTLGTNAFFISNGYVLGLQAIMLVQLRNKESGIELNIDQESWMMSAPILIIFTGHVFGGFLTYKYGRRPVMIFSCLPTCSVIILYYAKNYVTLLIPFLMFATNGIGFPVGAMYIAEFSSPKYRTILVNFKTASMTIGVTVAHFLAFYYNWRDIILYPLVTSMISLIILATSPESPVWLASKGRFEECRKSFKWFRGRDDRVEFENLIESRKDMINSKEVTNKLMYREKIQKFFILCLDKVFLKAIAISLACSMFVDMTGKAVFGNYIIDALTATFGDATYIFHATLAMDVIELVTLLSSCIAAQKFNIRSLLFKFGVAAIIVLMIFCLASYLFANNYIPIRFRWFTLILIITYFSLLNIGVVPTLLCIPNEITPISHRELGMGFNGLIFVSFLFTSIKITPYLMKYCDMHGTFLIFGIILIVSLIYLNYFLPETQSKTLQDIEIELSGKNKNKIDDAYPQTKEPLIETNVIKSH